MENRLGAAVQLCTLPWLGWIPEDLVGCPSAAVSRLGSQLELAPDDMRERHDLINFYGTYHFDGESELRRQGHRPLRSPAA